jgi:selenocysteine-specific elongation factor
VTAQPRGRGNHREVHVVATAGHVDHGKSTLVLALTGTDPDRWAEEKARGLTIDLGFAGTTLPSGRGVAFVDVPGHVRFLKNMLAGVGAVDACVFVVAATEGWKPQSEEHLRILELLGTRAGVIALTKVAGLDADEVELAQLEVAERVAGTFLDHAEVVRVDAPAGVGLHELAAALDRLLAETPTSTDRGRPRLWVDRSFAPAGAGTVVTGTLAGGTLHVDDELVIVPSGAVARVRGLQALHHQESELAPGNRAAVNLSGVAHSEVRRGDALVRAGQWHLTQRVDASLHVLASLDHAVSRRGAYLAYIGSGEHAVDLRVLGPMAIQPGGDGHVRLHLAAPVPLVPGDRYVLRESGRAETVGGGEVLDVAPLLPAARARPDRSVDRVIAERGWVDVDELERLTGERRPATVARWVIDPALAVAINERVITAVDAAGPLGLDVSTLDSRERLLIEQLDDITVIDGFARRAATADPLAGHPFVAELERAGTSPPPPDGVDRNELRALVQRGLVIERGGFYFASSAVADAASVLAHLLAAHPDGITVAEARDALGCTRKHAVPLLELFDATGVTRRRGDLRVAGPRLPEV